MRGGIPGSVGAGAGGGVNSNASPLSGQVCFGALASSTEATANRQYLIPMVPTSDFSIDAVCWNRGEATSGGVYIGIYDRASNLITDCAEDTDTTIGVHAVSTTEVDLVAGETYFLTLNASANIASRMGNSSSIYDAATYALFWRFAPLPRNDSSNIAYAFSDIVTYGALASSITIGDFLTENNPPLFGVRAS